jgi:hypothetical protein
LHPLACRCDECQPATAVGPAEEEEEEEEERRRRRRKRRRRRRSSTGALQEPYRRKSTTGALQEPYRRRSTTGALQEGGFPLHSLCPSLGMHPTHGAGSMCGAFRIGGGSQHVGFPKSSQPLGGYQQQIPPIPPSPPLPPLGPFKQTDRQTESYSDSRPGSDLEGTTVEPSSLAPAFSFSYSYSFQLHQL